MKKILFTIVMMVFFVLNFAQLSAQNKIKGVFVDSLSNQPVMYATIKVVNQNQPEKIVVGSITNEKGEFLESLIKKGNYSIELRSMGKKVITKNFTFNGGIYDFGQIYTVDDVDTLEVVTVTAQKKLIVQEAGKTKFNADADPAQKTSSVLDLLKKLPGVNVDAQDNITINGSSNFSVYMNGRKNSMMTSHPSQMLKGMPATSVKTIELITDPGAKFDAEGSSCVINLITDKKANIDVQSGSISIKASNKQNNLNARYSVQKGKFATSFELGGSQNNSKLELFNTTQNKQTDYRNDYQFSSKNPNYGSWGGVEMSYQADSLNLFAFNVGFWNWYTKTQTDDGYSSYIDNTLSQPEIFLMSINNKDDAIGLWGGISYQHNFKKNQQKSISFSYEINTDPWNEDNTTLIDASQNGKYSTPSNRYTKYQDLKEHIFQIDFTNPITSSFNLDCGTKVLLRPDNADNKYYVGDDMILDKDQSINFKHYSNVLAGYLEASKNFSKVSIRAGVRYEHTFNDAKYISGNGQDFNNNYALAVPRLMTNFILSASQTLGINYSMGISRPDIYKLNPFVQKQDPYAWIFGNADLKYENIHNFSLRYGYNTAKINLNASLTYSYTPNNINQYSYFENDIMMSTYANNAKTQKIHSNIYFGWQMAKAVRLNLGGNVYYNTFNNQNGDLISKGMGGNLWSQLACNLKKDFTLQIFYMNNFKSKGYQSISTGYQLSQISLNKSLLDKKLTLGIEFLAGVASNPKYISMKQETITPYLYSSQEIKVDIMRFGLSLMYNFGGNVDVKKARQHDSLSDRQSQSHDSSF